jgi:HlyD family secretion protein
MKTRTLLGWLILAVVLGGGLWWWTQRQAASDAPRFRTAKIERGSLTATVAASGTLAATVQVQVSSQVSGQIREVLTDFNAEVRKGQVLARLDPETLEYRVRQSEADLEAARAQVGVQQATVAARRSDLARARINLEEARRDLERKQDLVARNFISPAERDKAQSVARALEQDVASAAAQVELAGAQVRNASSMVRQREAQLASAKVDLGRTVIRAPVDGVVIKRSIEPGQTVAVSLQAPELFLIARNLRDMQVEVSVDEAEVARLRVGQRATFTVDAFPGRTFEGLVTQVRKASKNEQNVITYTALVSADNDNQALLPGMTANVRIVTDVRSDVLKVPNSALRFRPPGWSDTQKSVGLPGPVRVAIEALASPASAQSAAPVRSAAPAGAAGGGAAPAGGAMQALRERLERDLALTPDQKVKLDEIFAAMRGQFAAMRDTPESERAKLAERNRAELRARIGEILDPAQKKKYGEILVELSGRTVARGRVFVPGPDGQPAPLELRLGLSDGLATEIVGVVGDRPLQAGDLVYVGVVSGGASGSRAARSGSPRF